MGTYPGAFEDRTEDGSPSRLLIEENFELNIQIS